MKYENNIFSILFVLIVIIYERYFTRKININLNKVFMVKKIIIILSNMHFLKHFHYNNYFILNEHDHCDIILCTILRSKL